MRVILLTCLAAVVAGHGLMNFPPTRASNSMKTAGGCHGEHPEQSPQSGTCLWFNQGCQPGCNTCSENCTGFFGGGFAKCCDKPMEPTIDTKFWTFSNSFAFVDVMKHNPWRSPGFAPIYDPCGLAGGAYRTRKPDPSWYPPPSNSGKPPVGIELGTSGQDLPRLEGVNTEWVAGSQQEVSWNIVANHGGGYAYRLCPILGHRPTEECFQAHHLQFVGNSSWIQYGDNVSNRTAIPATRVSVGTNPPGSEWMKNPIPACSGIFGGGGRQPGCNTPQFQPPLADQIPAHKDYAPTPGLYGFGKARCGGHTKECSEDERNFWKTRFSFNIIDRVQVPADLPAGDYLLSFRWDSEQSPQIWSNCADVTIVAPSMMV